MTETTKQYLMPTPGGAYYLAQNNSADWKKEALKKLFSQTKTPELTTQYLHELFETNDEEQLSAKLSECKQHKIIQVINEQVSAPAGLIEDNLQTTLKSFSNVGKALLSDSQGFCIDNQGFPEETAEEISVLSADIAIMHKRRALDINKKLGLNSQAWSIVDASGNSCLGFWPLNIDDEVFVLTIESVPFFNQPEMISLIWMLYLRYGNK